MATHIDPFAPGDSPQHPANWKTEAPVSSTDLAARIIALEERHTLPSERERSEPVGLAELERRQALVDAYNTGLAGPTTEETPIAVYIEDQGVTYRWEEAFGWAPIPPAEIAARAAGADQKAASTAPSAPENPEPSGDDLAAALARLDAAKGK